MIAKYFFRWIVCTGLGLALMASGCDSTDATGDGGKTGDGKVVHDGGGGTPDTGTPPPGVVSFHQAGESVEVEKGNTYLVVPYSVSGTAATGISFSVKLAAGSGNTSDGGVSSSGFQIRSWPTQRPPGLRLTNPALWAKWQKRLAVEAWTRKVAERAVKARMLPPPSRFDTPFAGESCVLSSECAAKEICHEGKCETDPTLNVGNFSQTATIQAKVAKKGTKAAILVDSADTVDSGKVDTLLEKFENLILPRDTALFGNPALKSGAETLCSDRNGDGLLWLVLTSKVKEKEAVGFFDRNDFTEEAKSNKADILYIDATAETNDTYPILAHELQHLLSFAVKVYKPKANNAGEGALEALWLDEGLSHFAEDACGYGGENVVVLAQEVFGSFSDTSLFQEDPAGDSLAMRGMAMTFVRYLFERKGAVSYGGDGGIEDKGGAAWLQSIYSSSKQGTAVITETYGDYKAAFDNWVAAMALDGREVTDFAAYNFNDPLTDPVTQNEIGVSIRGKRKDHTGATVDLLGPLEEEITDDTDGTIPNGTAKLYKYSTSDPMKVSVETEEKSDFRFAVIKVK